MELNKKNDCQTKLLAPKGVRAQLPEELALIFEKNPGCLGYIGDEILPSYVGMIL